MEKVLLGVGNTMRADDGIGCYVADNLDSEGWKSINCGVVPENYTSIVRKENPKLVVIVDSAEMGLEFGEFRIIPKEKLNSLKLTTHAMPLSVLVSYLEDFVEKVVIIGIQPKLIEDKEGLSEECINGAEELIRMIKKDEFDKIKKKK